METHRTDGTPATSEPDPTDSRTASPPPSSARAPVPLRAPVTMRAPARGWELRFEFLVPLIAAFVVAMLWVGAYAEIGRERAAAGTGANERSMVASYRLAERIERLLQQADHTARLAARLYEQSAMLVPHGTAEPRALPATDALVLSIADARGRVVASTAPLGAPVDVSDRESFLIHRARRSDALYVGTPVLSRLTGHWTVPLSRGIWASDGNFMGAVAVLLDPERWLDGFSASDLGPDSWAGVFDDDLSYRVQQRAGKLSFGGRADLDERGPAGWGIGNAPDGTQLVEGARRYVSFVPVAGHPLTVGVGIAQGDALQAFEHWKTQRLRSTAWWSALTLVVALAMGVQFGRLRAARLRVLEATRRMHSAIEAGLDAFFVLKAQRDAAGRIVDFECVEANERGLQIFASPRPEVVGRMLSELLPFARDNGFVDQCIAVHESRQPLEQEFRVPPCRLTPKWIHQYVVATDEGVAITSRDVSQRKAQQRASDHERRFLKALIDSLPLGVTVKDATAEGYGRFVFTNEEARRIIGVAASPVGKTAHELYASKLAEVFAEQDRQVLERREPMHFTDNVIPGKPDARVVNFIKVPVLDRAGKPAQLLVIAEDVTARRSDQERVQLAREIFDQSEDMIVVTDAADRITFVNRAFVTTAGYTGYNLEGRQATDVGVPPLPGAWIASLHDVPTGSYWRGETTQTLRSGQALPCWLRAKAVSIGMSRHAFIRVWSDITPIKRAQDELSHLALHDELTGVANRVAFRLRFEQALERARRTREPVVLYFMDMNGFKAVNDEFGHRAGDDLLRELATRLRDAVRSSDLVGRLGGDEFGVLAEGLSRRDDIDTLTMRIRRATAWRSEHEGRALRVSASVGLCVCPAQADTVEEAMRIADAEMYREKRLARDPGTSPLADSLV